MTLSTRPVFNEELHKYNCPITNEEYTSVTTLIHKFEPKKDWNAIASAYAKKNGNTVEYWLEKWRINNLEACERGSAFHKIKEDLDNAEKIQIFKGTEIIVRGNSHLQVSELKDLPDGVYTELRLWNAFVFVAGHADKVIIYTIAGVRYCWIIDYKTNKEIKVDYNYIDKHTGAKITNEYLLAPLNTFVNCNHSIYQLQLNIYAWLLEQAGFVLAGGEIIHVKEGQQDVIYPLWNLQDQVSVLMTHWYKVRKDSVKKNVKSVVKKKKS